MRVRDAQARVVDDDAVDPEDVEVEGARAPALAAHAAKRSLDAQQKIEQREGGLSGLKQGRGVQEISLWRADRRGLDEGAVGEQGRVRQRGEGCDGAAQGRLAVAEVGAEADDDAQRGRGRS